MPTFHAEDVTSDPQILHLAVSDPTTSEGLKFRV